MFNLISHQRRQRERSETRRPKTRLASFENVRNHNEYPVETTERQDNVGQGTPRAINIRPVCNNAATANVERTAYLSSLTRRREDTVTRQVRQESLPNEQSNTSVEGASHLSISATGVTASSSISVVAAKTPVGYPSEAPNAQDTLERPEPSPSRPTVFALLIAINQYSKDGIRSLEGCVNDAKEFHEYLKTTHKVPARHILTLLNESATRDNILAAFNSHLIQNAQITKGDLIFFFYAGHGDSVMAPGWTDDSRRVETICPYDITVFEADQARHSTVDNSNTNDITYGIPDRTFNALMRQLASEKGDNIVAILDSCHSGGIARDSGASGLDRDLAARGNLEERPPLPFDLDRDLFNGVLDQDPHMTRGMDLITPKGFAYSGSLSHVLLAACQPSQKARELADPTSGRKHGRFTYHLLRSLRSIATTVGQATTYAALVDTVSARMNAESGASSSTSTGTQKEVQQPHCEGRNKYRLLFTTEVEPPSYSFPLEYQPVRPEDPKGPYALYVKAGSAQGFSENTCLVYRYRATGARDDGTDSLYKHISLIPSMVEARRSRLTIKDDPVPSPLSAQSLRDRPTNTTMASVSTWGYKAMKVWCGQDSVPQSISQVDNGDLFTITSHDDADIRRNLHTNNPHGYRLERRDPLIAHFQGTKPVLDLPSSAVSEEKRLLNSIAHFNYHLYRFNSADVVRKDLAFEVKLHSLERHDNGGLQARFRVKDDKQDILSVEHHIETPTPATYTLCDNVVKEARIVDVDTIYGINVVNNSAVDMLVYVFYFDPVDYSIRDCYNPSNPKLHELPAGGCLAVGHGMSSEDAFRFRLSDGNKRETGFLKVFVSNTEIDLRSMVQASPLDPESQTTDRAMYQRRVELSAGWSSAIYALTVEEK